MSIDDFDQIAIQDTCITPEMEQEVAKEDYKYYYVDKRYSRPETMEYYTPPEELLMIGAGKKNPERMIYPLDGPYTEQEETTYEQLLEYFEDKDTEIPECMTKRRALRFLNGNAFNVKKTYKNIVQHLEWREEMKPFILTQGDMQLLDKGFLYIHGRDKNFRPFLITNAIIIAEKGINPDDVFHTSWFMCHFLIENILKRGSVENWVEILDLGGLPISKIPVKALKKFMIESQIHMKSRIAKMFLLYVTWGIRTIYAIISPFLEKRTKEKIVMKKGGFTPNQENFVFNEEILEIAHPSQIEEKYGGEAENLTEHWPPISISDEYGTDPECITKSSSSTTPNTHKRPSRVHQEAVGTSSPPSQPKHFITDPILPTEDNEPDIRPAPVAGKGKNCTCTIF
ncbi:unnamed protein product [Moneuplotes crassus]|uniref:CRAL-TRIO domain-containing protein n=1 Tax=Euplotes crassus TaxID=5936 RepID=A0AAD1ULZ4_EUPCR|nr:unnamed protein product [Moneuplotes crassus]